MPPEETPEVTPVVTPVVTRVVTPKVPVAVEAHCVAPVECFPAPELL